jgi:ubiquinone/menaquinone biosynthesis C-methylase UbiE
MLADAMVALRLLEHTENRYRNAPVAVRFLAGQGEGDLSPFLRFWNRFSYPAWQHLEAAVRTDQPAPRPGPPSAEDQQIISQGIEASTRRTAVALADTYDFLPHRRILDAGGGTGSFLLAILERFPETEGTLFDLQSVTLVARERLSQHPDGSRVQLVAGDFMADPLPAGHDVVILSNVIHLFAPERNRTLLSRVREAVSPEARLLIVDRWTDPTRAEPLSAALAAGEYLLAAGGDVYSVEDGREWLEATGWRVVDHAPLADGWSTVIAEAH